MGLFKRKVSTKKTLTFNDSNIQGVI